MADHLTLGLPVPLSSKRALGYDSTVTVFDRQSHATTLAGVLAGLQSGSRPLFREASITSAEDDDELHEMGTVVLKFTTKGAPVRGPFNKWDMHPVGETADNEYYVLSSASSRQIFANVIARYGTENWDSYKSWETQLDNIKGVSVYARADRADSSLDSLNLALRPIVDVVLWPTSILSDKSAERVAHDRVAEVSRLVEDLAGQDPEVRVVATDTRPDTVMLRVAVNQEVLDALLVHHFVQRIRGPLSPIISQSLLIDSSVRTETPKPAGASIGVIDDLVVTANPLMTNVVQDSTSFPGGYPFGAATNHGTTVASIAAYGNLEPLVHGAPAPVPFPILAVRISQADQNLRPTVVGTVVDQFERALTWIAESGGRIAVIAFNYPHADREALPTELTATIDRLARDLRLVIVISAGNIGTVDPLHWHKDYPSYLTAEAARIAAPGGAALALTVGAIAHRATPGGGGVAIAPKDKISPFSRTGPTRGHTKAGTQKPEFSAPGGNWSWDTADTLPRILDPNLGVVGLTSRPGRPFEVSTGTSVAAPFVAHQVAKIATRYPQAGPNLLRAITALSAPQTTLASDVALGDAVGHAYGVPDAERVLESGMNRAIVVYEGDMTSGSRVVHELPIPEEFAAGVLGSQRFLRIALAFDPPVRRSRREYVAGHMRFDFVRNMPLDDVIKTYEKQYTLAERKADATLRHFELPDGNERPSLFPRTRQIGSNTLIRRDFKGAFEAADETYFLVVHHDQSQWTAGQKKEYKTQSYALAIEIIDVFRTDLDLHALVKAQLEAVLRQRARISRTGGRNR